MAAKHRIALFLLACVAQAHAQPSQRVVDVPTRPGVSQRMLLLEPPAPKAAVILLAGGHGGLQIFPNGSFNWGEGNFLVRTRQLFADQGLLTAVIDAPSDRQRPPYLSGFRQTPEHVADLKAAIAWLRAQAKLPVWLVGTSRGTQSAAFVATQLDRRDGPDGLVLTSTILSDRHERPVPDMALDKLQIPVLVVHHEQDGCKLCAYGDIPALMRELERLPNKQLLSFRGGQSRGDPCQAFACHGYNGLEREVATQIAAWIASH